MPKKPRRLMALFRKAPTPESSPLGDDVVIWDEAISPKSHLDRCAAVRIRALAQAMQDTNYGEFFHIRQSQELIDDLRRAASALYPEK